MSATLTGCCESTILRFKVGYPLKDSQGNAIDRPEGVILQVQYPGTDTMVTVGSCVFPQNVITWDVRDVPDGEYIGQAKAFTYRGHCGGKGGCPIFGPPCVPFAITIKNARPGAPPQPIEMMQDCCQSAPVAGAPSVTMA